MPFLMSTCCWTPLGLKAPLGAASSHLASNKSKHSPTAGTIEGGSAAGIQDFDYYYQMTLATMNDRPSAKQEVIGKQALQEQLR